MPKISAYRIEKYNKNNVHKMNKSLDVALAAA